MKTAVLIVAAVWLLPSLLIVAWVLADRWLDSRMPSALPTATVIWLRQVAESDEPVVVPLATSDRYHAILTVMAANEAARLDPDVADWSEPSTTPDPWADLIQPDPFLDGESKP